MSLGKKIVVLFLALGCSFSLGSYLVLGVTILPAFEEFEIQSAEQSMMRATDALASEMQALTVMNIEYSLWDQAYEYALGRRPDYKEENLDPSYWHSVEVDMMMYFDVEGEILFGHLVDPHTGFALDPAEEFYDALAKGNPLVTHADESSFVKGILPARTGLLQIASYPILRSDGTGPIVGSIVVGRFLTDERISGTGSRSTAEIALFGAENPDLAERVAIALAKLSGNGESSTIEVEEAQIRAYSILPGIYGQPAAILEVTTPRNITAIGSDTINAALMLLLAASLIFLFAASFFTQQLIVKPVRTLTEKILAIRKTGDLVIEVDGNRNDEVGTLAKEFGELTSELKDAQVLLESARDDAMALVEAKTEFLARMSHEIRTPMNGVLGMTELLQDTSLDSNQLRVTETIYDSASALLDIINDILDFSKIESGKMQLDAIEVDLRRIVEDTVESVAGPAHKKGIELISIISQDMNTSVVTDPMRLRQVLTNLIGNAIKFTDNGEVKVEISTATPRAGQVSATFAVTDTGIGIRAEKLDHIFDSFMQEDGSTTRLYGGTGLGLTISKQIVDAMGGNLTVQSQPGKGSRFSFNLELNTGSLIETIPESQLQHIADTHVLVVDDNATNREILDHQLRNWRAIPTVASSADEGMKFLERAVKTDTPYELAILDMHMPVKDGLDLAREIRGNPELDAVKLVILSSVTTPVPEETLNELNIAGQLSKPVHQSRLYAVLVTMMTDGVTTATYKRQIPGVNQTLQGNALLAEDNPVNQAVAIGMLESLGVQVTVANNGEEAAEKCRDQSFDVILMDCQMPVMDGFDATGLIRAREIERGQQRTPIIAVTANALKGDREKCLTAGMSEYLTKPFTREQLHATLAPLLQSERHANAAVPVESRAKNAVNDEAPPIDAEVLAALELLQNTGTPDIKNKVVGIYLESSHDLVSRIKVAAKSDDAETVRSAAHALKSSSANVGATGLAEICKQLESTAREGEMNDVAAGYCVALDDEYERVVDALRQELEADAA